MSSRSYGGSGKSAGRTEARVEPFARAPSRHAATPGLDGLYVGPNDLALALGVAPGQVPAAAEIERAWERVVRAAHDAGVYAGSFCADGTVAAHLVSLGYDLVTPGNDAAQLRAGAVAALAAARGGLPAAATGSGY